MTTNQRLIDEAAAGLAESALGDDWRRLVHPIIRLLAEGRPVSTTVLAAASGIPIDRVERALADFGDVEWSDDHRIVGMGLTQRQTPHRMTIGGQALYAWCAMDTLVFAVILDRPVTIESPDHATGEPVRIEADGQRVISVDPASAVVSWWTDPSEGAVRAKFCSHGHFFGSAATAAGWMTDHPGGSILPLDEAFAAASRMVFELLGEPAGQPDRREGT